MKNHIYLIVLLSILSTSIAKGQNTGFGGKRLVIKTDVLNGLRSPLLNVTAEVIVARNFTFSVGYRATKGEYNQIYFPEEYASGDHYEDGNKLIPKAEIISRTIMLEGRLYFTGVVPAPRGSFVYAGYNYGTVDVTGNYRLSLTLNDNSNSSYYNNSSSSYYNNGTQDLFFTYEAEKVLAIGVEAGYGYQSFIAKNVTLGFKIGLNKTFFNANGKYEDKALSGVAKTYGPNFFRVSPVSGDIFSLNSLYGSGSDTGNSYYKGSLGVAFYLQLGILLF